MNKNQEKMSMLILMSININIPMKRNYRFLNLFKEVLVSPEQFTDIAGDNRNNI